MFPNVRLLIVAMFVSIIAMSCGLGAVAAFRVSRETFTRLPTSTAPPQLVFDNTARLPVTDATAAPFGIRFQVSAPVSPIGSATEAAPVPAPLNTATAGMPPPNAQDSSTERDEKAVGSVAAIEPPAEQSLPADAAVQDTKAAPDVATPAAATTVEKTDRKASRRRRLAAMVRRSRKAQASAVALPDQNSGFSQLNFQSAPNASQQQPVRSRRVVRTAAKRIAANSAVGGPFVRRKSP